ncbi:MAG: hypothetical protein HY796_09260 [Elusimicrobia bacterium]|nr:hypothetical protein [Elusimicrobiota bacterium]
MKKTLPGKTLFFALIFILPLVLWGSLSLVNSQSGSGGGLSRSMEQAIRLYHDGQDNEAMDRFMEILVKGTPSEKSLANEYISKITMRMNSGVATFNDRAPEEGALKEVPAGKPQQVPVRKSPAAAEDLTPSEAEAADAASARSQRERMAAKISEKITGMRRNILLELNKSDAVRIYMDEAMPRAVTINSAYFFANETAFKPDAAGLLTNLAGLIFTLGKANCLILPEGTVENDVKIKSIRRAIALNSYFASRGVSQSRLDVNLTGGEIKFPKELTNLSGIVMLFNYDKEPRLTQLEDLRAKGPKVSLGIYPTAVSTQKNEGALVEFSVFESPLGKPTWKFEIFSVQPDNSIIQLQKMDGYGAQYNQSYWNGRKNFFGAAYPSGKYMFSVTAADSQGLETNMRKLLVIKPSAEEERAMLARAAAAARQAAPKSGLKKRAPVRGASPAGKSKAGVKTGISKLTPLSKKKSAKKTAPAGESQNPPEAAPKKGAAADDAQEAAEFSVQMSYKIYFKEHTAIVTPNSEKKLSQVAETMNYYPMAKVKLTGYAYSGEANSQTMAENRVNYVANRLAVKYKIEKERIDTATQIVDSPKSIVEIKMVGKE